MHTNTGSQDSTSTAGDQAGHALLQYEIRRIKSCLTIHGETHTLRERLDKLEDLMESCAAVGAHR